MIMIPISAVVGAFIGWMICAILSNGKIEDERIKYLHIIQEKQKVIEDLEIAVRAYEEQVKVEAKYNAECG